MAQNTVFDIIKGAENSGSEQKTSETLQNFQQTWLTKTMMKDLYESVMNMNYEQVFSTCYAQREGLEYNYNDPSL